MVMLGTRGVSAEPESGHRDDEGLKDLAIVSAAIFGAMFDEHG
jgi:hypothetical protein